MFKSIIEKNATKLIEGLFDTFLEKVKGKIDDDAFEVVENTLNECLDMKPKKATKTKDGKAKPHGGLNAEIKRVMKEELGADTNPKVSGTLYRFAACKGMEDEKKAMSDDEILSFIENTTNKNGEKRSGRFKNEHKMAAQMFICKTDEDGKIEVHENEKGKEFPVLDLHDAYEMFRTFCLENEQRLLEILDDEKTQFEIDEDGNLSRVKTVSKKVAVKKGKKNRKKKKADDIDALVEEASEKPKKRGKKKGGKRKGRGKKKPEPEPEPESDPEPEPESDTEPESGDEEVNVDDVLGELDEE